MSWSLSYVRNTAINPITGAAVPGIQVPVFFTSHTRAEWKTLNETEVRSYPSISPTSGNGDPMPAGSNNMPKWALHVYHAGGTCPGLSAPTRISPLADDAIGILASCASGNNERALNRFEVYSTYGYVNGIKSDDVMTDGAALNSDSRDVASYPHTMAAGDVYNIAQVVYDVGDIDTTGYYKVPFVYDSWSEAGDFLYSTMTPANLTNLVWNQGDVADEGGLSSPIMCYGRAWCVTSDGWSFHLEGDIYATRDLSVFTDDGSVISKHITGLFFASGLAYDFAKFDYDTICKGYLVDRFNPRSNTGGNGLYAMNNDQLSLFLKDLWTTDIWENFNQMFTGDGSDALLGLRWFFGLNGKAKVRDGLYNVMIGNVRMGDNATRGVQALAEEFVVYDCGNLTVTGVFGDWRDYEWVEYKAYLPFIGLIDLNPNDVVNKEISLKYAVNMSDGTAVCFMSLVSEICNTGQIFSSTCSWGYDVPMKVDSMKDAGSIVAGSAIRAIGGAIGGAVVGNVPGAVIGGLTGAASGVAGAHSGTPQYSAGSMSPNANVMGDFNPKILKYTKADLVDSDYSSAVGYPAGSVLTIGVLSGYVQADAVYGDGFMRHGDRIVELLKEGIYI